MILEVLIPISILFVRIDGPSIVYNYLNDNYSRWQRLTQLVATRESNIVRIYMISMQMVMSNLYLSLIQYMNNSVKKINSNTYEVSYIVNGHKYKMLVPHKRGCQYVSRISNENGDDVTDIIRPYMGPKHDWHGNIYKPVDFGSAELIFEFVDGKIYTSKKITSETIEGDQEDLPSFNI